MAGGKQWFRVYAEAAHDPKLRQLAPAVRWYWVSILCACCAHGGRMPCAPETHAVWLGVRTSRAREVLAELHHVGLLDIVDDHYVPHNWQGRQYVSDSSTERVKRFRDRSRNVSETLQQRVTETHQSRAEQNRAEEEEESKQENKIRGAHAVSPPANGRLKNGTQLPADWQPTEADLAYAGSRQLQGQQLGNEIEKFRNYWIAKSGRDACKRDWSATWRNWVLNGNARSSSQPTPQCRHDPRL